MAKEIKTIGVLTSGGDAPGMNAAIRAVVRKALVNGKKVKGILKGYSGLLNEEIIDMSANDVSNTIERGGTILFTARCKEFMTEEGQQRGAEICRKHGLRQMLSFFSFSQPARYAHLQSGMSQHRQVLCLQHDKRPG